MPWTEPGQPSSISGRVTFVSEVRSEWGGLAVPQVELRTGDGTRWSVRAYRADLREALSNGLAVGDYLTLTLVPAQVKVEKA